MLAVGVGTAHAVTLTPPTTLSTAGCGTYTLSLPSGVTTVTFRPRAAGAGSGGHGDEIAGALTGVSNGQSVYVCVDYGGGAADVGQLETGAGGGGASGLSIGTDFTDPVVVAGGGGGAMAAQGETPVCQTEQPARTTSAARLAAVGVPRAQVAREETAITEVGTGNQGAFCDPRRH